MPLQMARKASVAVFVSLGSGLFLSGCASPGMPKPPSLQLPEIVQDLTALRSGDTVQLRFSVPERSTDNLPLQGSLLTGLLCRQETRQGACIPVDTAETSKPLPVPHGGQSATVLWTDPLPRQLGFGLQRILLYRVLLRNAQGKTAGYSDPVFTLAGIAPPPVEHGEVQGVRSGVLLSWTAVPQAGEVLVERRQLDPAPIRKSAGSSRETDRNPFRGGEGKTSEQDPGVVWLQANPGNTAAAQTIDGTATEGVRYSYTLVRRTSATLGGHVLSMQSAPSAPLSVVWHDIYPPPAPTGLTAIGFTAAAAGKDSYAVDLVWQPVNDPRVAGYLVRREQLSANGAAQGSPEQLTAQPVATPAFHDTSVLPDRTYRYAVLAVDARGNRSPAATAVVRGSSEQAPQEVPARP